MLYKKFEKIDREYRAMYAEQFGYEPAEFEHTDLTDEEILDCIKVDRQFWEVCCRKILDKDSVEGQDQMRLMYLQKALIALPVRLVREGVISPCEVSPDQVSE